jgi:O-antigen/teichoic acid export membrane protein
MSSQLPWNFGRLATSGAALYGRYGTGSLEQIVIALLNFGIVTASGTILPPAAFSVFVVIMASLTLAFALSGAFISAPVLVLYRKRYAAGSKDYLGKVEWMNVAVCLPACLACLAVARLFESQITILNTFCAFLALQAWSSYDLRRKRAFALGIANRLLPCSALVLAANIAGVLALLPLRQNHEWGMLLVLAVSYGIGIVVFDFTCPPPAGLARFQWQAVAADHWQFGGSLVASVAFYWLGLQGYFLIAAKYVSAEALGGARTAQNLAGLISMGVLMFENHSTPEAARIEHSDGKLAVRLYIQKIFRNLSLPFLGLCIVAAAIGFGAHRILYRDHYAAYSHLIFLFAFHQFLAGASRPYAVGLKAVECTKPIFWGYFFPAVVTLLIGWLIVREFHASGIGIGFVLSALLTLLIQRSSFKNLTL